MKLKLKLLLTIILIVIACSNSLFAQPFITSGAGSGNNIGETNANDNITAIGVGDFVANGDEPQAALDVRVPLLKAGNFVFDYAEAFQTTSLRDYGAVWRMFTGKETWARDEKFHILNPNGNSNDIELNVVQDGDMNFFTNSSQFMQLSNYGSLGISDKWGGWEPYSVLHMNRDGDNDVYAQFTNDNTGRTSNTLGFKLGI